MRNLPFLNSGRRKVGIFLWLLILHVNNILDLSNTVWAQTRKTGPIVRQNTSRPDKMAEAREFYDLLKKARQEKSQGPYLSNRDIHGVYRRQTDPRFLTLRQQALRKNAESLRKKNLPSHRVSVVAAPASMLGPISLGPAYGVFMFQYTLNSWPEWQGPAIPWAGNVGSRYILSSGPITIPYELALQNRLVLTTVTNAYGNQVVTLTDNSTGFSNQYEIIGRLDAFGPQAMNNSLYGRGYYVSTYTGNILGTNSSSYPGVFVPGSMYPTTFGYSGDLDTLGPFGRGQTPLNPTGPVPVQIPGMTVPGGGVIVYP